jgi:hypothetical protein
MVIRVEDDPHTLLDLLWIREAWGLEPAGDDLPPLLVATPEREPDEPDPRWAAAWPDLWRACLAHAAAGRDPGLVERLHATPDGSAERAELLGRLFGPSWHGEFGEAAFTERHAAWTTARNEETSARMRQHRPLDEEPERASLRALVPAWEAGLTTVIVLPLVGEYTRRVGPNALAVTPWTRDDRARYAEALGTFA